jgi:hypothetical protein
VELIPQERRRKSDLIRCIYYKLQNENEKCNVLNYCYGTPSRDVLPSYRSSSLFLCVCVTLSQFFSSLECDMSTQNAFSTCCLSYSVEVSLFVWHKGLGCVRQASERRVEESTTCTQLRSRGFELLRDLGRGSFGNVSCHVTNSDKKINLTRGRFQRRNTSIWLVQLPC